MELFLTLLAFIIGVRHLKNQDQRQRIALLGSYIGKYQVEKLMEQLVDGYMRAMGESDLERRAQLWSHLSVAEGELSEQLNRFVDDFANVWGDKTQVSTLRLALPYGSKIFPRLAFDLRHALAIHAQGIAATLENRQQLSPRDKAYQMTAEILLMQHTCHWYCRSRAVASARLVAQHHTQHAQLISAVSRQTREAYCQLTGTS